MRELAYAKLNLVLHVGPRRVDGLHPISSLFASIDLADEIRAETLDDGEDVVECAGVPGDNLAARALREFRSRAGGRLPPLRLTIDKRIPVAAGLGGGSADAAAALRIANELSGQALTAAELLRLAADLGSDVPSQLDPRHALVEGVGERVEPVTLPPFTVVVLPDYQGLRTADVYAELDRLHAARHDLDAAPIRELVESATTAHDLAAALENDLQPPALSLRPDLEAKLEALRDAGALGAAISGSGPTCFGLFEARAFAERAAEAIPGALVADAR